MKIKFNQTAYTSAGRFQAGEVADLKEAECKQLIGFGVAIPDEVAQEKPKNRAARVAAKRV